MLQLPWTIKTVVKTGQDYMVVSLIWWRLWGQVKRGICRVTKLHKNKNMCDQNEFSGSGWIQGMVWYWLRWDNWPEFGLVYAGTAGLERNNAIVPDHPKVFVVTLSPSLVTFWWFKILPWITKTSYRELVKHRGGQWFPHASHQGNALSTVTCVLMRNNAYWTLTVSKQNQMLPAPITCRSGSNPLFFKANSLPLQNSVHPILEPGFFHLYASVLSSSRPMMITQIT